MKGQLSSFAIMFLKELLVFKNVLLNGHRHRRCLWLRRINVNSQIIIQDCLLGRWTENRDTGIILFEIRKVLQKTLDP